MFKEILERKQKTIDSLTDQLKRLEREKTLEIAEIHMKFQEVEKLIESQLSPMDKYRMYEKTFHSIEWHRKF